MIIGICVGVTLLLLVLLGVLGFFVLREKPELIQEVAEIRREPEQRPRTKVRAAFDVIEDATKDLVAHDFFRTIATEEADQKFATIGNAFAKRQAKTNRRTRSPSPPKTGDDAGLFQPSASQA